MADNINLSFALNLPPEKIVEYFRNKGYAITFNWKELWQDAHHKAFTVAKAMDLDILKDIRGEVHKSIDKGITFREFQKTLEPILQKKGWWGKKYMFDNEGNFVKVQLGSPERLRTIYDTNLTVAYSTNRFKEQMENADHRPYWQYLAVMDENTRPSHALLHKKVFRYDHPFWKKYYPPNDWGCRCHVRALTEADLKKEGLTVETELPEGFNPMDFAPAEWTYNPGDSFWNWDKNALKEDSFTSGGKESNKIVSSRTYKDFNRPDVKDVDQSEYLRQPDLLPKAKTVDAAVFSVETALGLSEAVPAIEVNTPVETLNIRREQIPHFVEKRDNARERFANYILPTLKNPFEIYLTEYEDGFRRQYVGLFKGKYNMLCVVRVNKDGSLLWNIINADDRIINKKRVGDLIYSRK